MLSILARSLLLLLLLLLPLLLLLLLPTNSVFGRPGHNMLQHHCAQQGIETPSAHIHDYVMKYTLSMRDARTTLNDSGMLEYNALGGNDHLT